MTALTAAAAKMKAESDRQTTELIRALTEVIEAHGRRMIAEGRMPIMNAAISALAAQSGKAIASIEPRHRRLVQQQFESTLRHYRRQFETARIPAAETYNLAEPRQ